MFSGIAPLFGAILATAGLVFAAGALKATSFFFNLLVPLPIATLTLRQGLRPGLIALAVTAGLFAAVSPTDGMVVYLLQFSIASLLLPLLLRQGRRWDKAIAISWAVILMSVAVVLVAEAAAQDISLSTMVNTYIAQEVGQLKELYSQSADLSAEQKEQLLTVLAELAKTMNIIWPAVVAFLAGFLLLIQVFLLWLLPATKDLLPGPVFIDWKVPDYLVWPMITAGFAAFFTTATLQSIAINLLIIMFPLYYLQGLAIVTYYFQQRGTSLWLRAVSYLLLALFNPLPFFLAGVGLFDLWGNFRKERVKPNPV
jgi:uncharacterized protein YybS (DUF2232 family)